MEKDVLRDRVAGMDEVGLFTRMDRQVAYRAFTDSGMDYVQRYAAAIP
jgi:hypothetical protein